MGVESFLGGPQCGLPLAGEICEHRRLWLPCTSGGLWIALASGYLWTATWGPEAEPREGLQLLLYSVLWHRLDINSVAPDWLRSGGLNRQPRGQTCLAAELHPNLPSFRGAANTFTFSWEVGLAIETCQEQILHHCSLQGGDMNSDSSTGLLCHGKPLMLFLSFIVLSLLRSMILLCYSSW